MDEHIWGMESTVWFYYLKGFMTKFIKRLDFPINISPKTENPVKIN